MHVTVYYLLHTFKTFWESHNPTQGHRQGNDIGSQYRSAIFTSTQSQLVEAQASLAAYQSALGSRHQITTELRMDTNFWPAEADHQQYLYKKPNGYCGLKGSGVACPLPSTWTSKWETKMTSLHASLSCFPNRLLIKLSMIIFLDNK